MYVALQTLKETYYWTSWEKSLEPQLFFFQDVFGVSSKPKVIHSTIRRLPVNYVIPFTTEVCVILFTLVNICFVYFAVAHCLFMDCIYSSFIECKHRLPGWWN
jgi:hypothetical protein